MGYGEDKLVQRLNKYFKDNGQTALAYRIPQVKRREQESDILIDSPDNDWYMAVEVKTLRGFKPLNFRSEFNNTTDMHQLERQVFFAERTGRTPIVYLIVRTDGQKHNKHYTFDSYTLLNHMKDGHKSLSWRHFDDMNIGWFDT